MSFYDTVIRNSKAFRSDARYGGMDLLEPGTRQAVTDMVAEAKADGHDLRVLETYRSQTRQSYLFTKHLTQLRNVGCHGYGVAVDFGVFRAGNYLGDDKEYKFIGPLARKHGMVSGLDWGHNYPNRGFVDSGHVQRVPIFRQNAMFNGAWYPPTVYDPYADMKANGVV
jgi:hypothetical protein